MPFNNKDKQKAYDKVRSQNPERKFKHRLRNLFQDTGHKINITLEQYQNKLKEQDYKCAICSQPFDKIPACIDHNHTTGQLRDILCRHCNSGIGFLKEDPTILTSAINYLVKHAQQH